MAIFKCKMCGGNLDVSEGATVCECDYCGTQQTVPKSNDDVISNLFNRANNLRLKCEFDKAAQIYEKIVEQDDSEAEAHWGIVLCKYGIEYVEDPKTLKRIPTCHRTLFDAATTDADYLAAIDYSDAAQQVIYEKEAKAIDKIQKDILAIVKNEKPFDVFICYKETDANGKRTIDSTIANDIYYQLTQEGFKVFYAAITLEDKLGQEYEPYIFAALNSSKVMLVLGTKPEYFSAVWVKNEWSRFMQLMRTDRSRLLIPCYRDMDAYELPEEFAHLQAQDMSKIGFINDVVRGIKKVSESTESAKTIVKETVATEGNTNTAPLLKRAFMFLEDGDFNSAEEYCEKVLDLDPECSDAYLGKLMVELRVKVQESLKDCAEPFDNNNNYQKAVRFGDDKLKTFLAETIQFINNRNENTRLEEIYNKACGFMDLNNKSSFVEAVHWFKKASGYKDADALADECSRKIAELKQLEEQKKAEEAAEAEKIRLEKERQTELNRIEAEKRAKRNKKIVIIATPIVCAVIAFVIVLNTVIIPNNKYNKAIALIDAGNIIEAYDSLIALDGYKDSTAKANSIYDKYRYEKSKLAEDRDTMLFGKYEQDTNNDNGKEAIEWIVLERKGDKLLLLSRYAIDSQEYGDRWGNPTINNWLNNDFVDKAFSSSEKQQIKDIFLLSVDEAKMYFDSNEERMCWPTERVKALGVYVDNSGSCSWWLDTSYNSQTSSVRYTGEICELETEMGWGHAPVRPAMWIDIDKTNQ